ncbi:hypothetical protein GDO81_006271 [Engystomops pustulosus]|uniref:Immunoglobulin domain-containing protein n=1 Tax=Engystomops pustulosus TaxID=76066 RepID=A0AAV7CVZ3_ENGPU|nr:hypothetical protein GDO81_006271 [Engystomops pustulosus]
MDRYVLQILTAVLLGISGMCLAKDITVYSGQPGETLNIICPYQKQTDRWKKKVWCKEDDVGFCQLLVSVHPYWSNFKRTNMSIDISDNYHKGILTINITNLQKSDAGVYQCRTVKFGDVNTLQRIRVQILEDQMNVNISELDNAQHIISGSQTEKEIPLMLVVIGCSLISFKLLLLGSIVIWWKRNESFYWTSTDHEPFSMPLSAGHSDAEYSLPNDREENNDYPQYINYLYIGHQNQAH